MDKDNIEVLFGKDTTPEQVLLNTLNALEEDGIKQLAVVYLGKDGKYHTCITGMKTPELFFLGVVLQRRALDDGTEEDE